MSKYDFLLYAGQSDDFIEQLRQVGLVDITTSSWEASDSDRELILAIEAHTKAIAALESFRKSDKFRAGGHSFTSPSEAYAQYTATQQTLTALAAEAARLEKSADELRGWGEFSHDEVAALSKRGVNLRYFLTSKSTFEKSAPEWEQLYAISLISTHNSVAHFVIVADPSTEIYIDAQEVKAPAMDYRQAEQLRKEALAQADENYTTLSKCAEAIELIKREEATLREKLQNTQIHVTAQSAADGELMIMEGWAEKESAAKVDALLDDYPNVIYIKSDPTPEDNTPVKLRNNRLSRPFELIGSMYAMPRYGTLDLTPFFAPFYVVFFGFCLAEAGYGLIILLAGIGMLVKGGKKMHDLANLSIWCGLSGTVFGILSGSFFGIQMSEWQWLGEMRTKFLQPDTLFTLALVLGGIQIVFGLILQVITKSIAFGFKYSLSVLGWTILVISSVGAMYLPEQYGFTLSSVPYFVCAGIGAFLMFFLNSPGRNPLFNIGVGLWDTYNYVAGIVGDLLSYIRLFAIGMSGGILALVFTQLAEGLSPDIPVVKQLVMIIILLMGHGINLFMCTLSSFVHPLRLTFVEFYKNAGFEPSTRVFTPLKKQE